MRFPYKIKDLKSIQKNFDYWTTMGHGRRIAGIIDTTAPTLIAGKGFTFTKVGTASIDVVYKRPFGTLPVITVSLVGPSGGFVIHHNDTTAGTSFITRDVAGAGQERIFHFVIEDPS